jgi:hypothetical protein
MARFSTFKLFAHSWLHCLGLRLVRVSPELESASVSGNSIHRDADDHETLSVFTPRSAILLTSKRLAFSQGLSTLRAFTLSSCQVICLLAKRGAAIHVSLHLPGLSQESAPASPLPSENS